MLQHQRATVEPMSKILYAWYYLGIKMSLKIYMCIWKLVKYTTFLKSNIMHNNRTGGRDPKDELVWVILSVNVRINCDTLCRNKVIVVLLFTKYLYIMT